ncbi:MAG: amidohydrolase family protein [Chloroflexota bacterium]|nr:amidohydrolase family protein [Chloroflexota bacterium]MDE2961121.1 amidohydrolase family protein [Chloroflexota bacterium]
MAPPVEIVLLNGKILAGEGSPSALAVAGRKVLAVGDEREIRGLATPDTTVLDCGGRRVIPGIVDAHCHVLAAAATSRWVDCRPTAMPDVDAVIDALREAPGSADDWIRGYGYDDSPAGRGRHLTRHDLDRVSISRPVRVDHRSGHACALNSRALASVGIDRRTSDPPGSVIVRDHEGEPTGLLLEMADWLRERLGVSDDASFEDVQGAVREFGDKLLAYGITAVTDAGPSNGLDRWRYFRRVSGDGTLPLQLTMMVGFDRLDEMLHAGLGYGATANDGRLTVSHAKIMLTASTGQLRPDPAQLTEMVAHAHRLGFPVAIHAVERDAVVAAALAIGDARPLIADDGSRVRDRIEHCAECPPDVLALVAQSGAMAVPNPGFLHYDGERYLRTVAADLLPHLYPMGALLARGIRTRLGSDAPVVEPNPWAAMAAAVSRQSAGGVDLGGEVVKSVAQALTLHSGTQRIAAGMPADLAVVDPDPFAVSTANLPEVRSVATIVAGGLVWRDGRPSQ